MTSVVYYESGQFHFIKVKRNYSYKWSSYPFRDLEHYQSSKRGVDREEPRPYTSKIHTTFVYSNNVVDPRSQPVVFDAPNIAPNHHLDAKSDAQFVFTQNRCRAKFGEKVNEAAELALLFAERKKAADLIGARANNLACFFKNLFKKEFRKAGRCIGIAKTNASKIQRNLNRAHLEYDYGWRPLLSDIHTAVGLLENPYPKAKVRVGTRTRNWTPWPGSPPYGWWSTHSCSMGAVVHVDNPGLYRASSAGLINPLSVAWELVPFSFLIDWFVPVGSLISSLTDLVGVSLEKDYTTNFRVHEHGPEITFFRDYGQAGWPYLPVRYRTSGFHHDRVTNIPGIIPQFSTFAFSANKALNALSLLSAIFTGKPSWLK